MRLRMMSRMIVGDWLDGYESVLLSLARGLGLRRGPKRPGTAPLSIPGNPAARSA